MGIYINPKRQSKEDWLQHNCDTKEFETPSYGDLKEGNLFVCLIDNGLFNAAGIAFNKNEFEAFAVTDRYRRKVWYQCSKDRLVEVTPELKGYL